MRLPDLQHHMLDEGQGLVSHARDLRASLPTPPLMGVRSTVLLRQGIGPTLPSSASGEGQGQLLSAAGGK